MSALPNFRLAEGGLIDRSRPLRFTFEGRSYQGFEGDSLASALLANGVRLFGRSFKYHRPRGLLAAGAEEPNALVQLGDGARSTPNMRATEVALYDGLVARPVNCWPSSRFDIGAVNDVFSRFLSAGFYYKTFMWPDWHLYERFIRKAAGLGRAASAPDPDRYETRFGHCDILVVGSGPAGLAAARAAAAGGARVILAEQDEALGGSLIGTSSTIDGLDAAAWALEVERQLADLPEVQLLRRTTVAGYHDHNGLTLVEQLAGEDRCIRDPAAVRYRLWQIRATRVILATGAIERPLVFPGNDRPGVMLAGAAKYFLDRHAVLAGDRLLLFTNNDHAFLTAFALADAGVSVAAVVDVRRTVASDLAAALVQRDIPLFNGAAVVATRGRRALKAARVRDRDGKLQWIKADLLAMSGGYNPNLHLFSQSGGALAFDEGMAAFLPASAAQAVTCIGIAAGAQTLADALSQGYDAGSRAARYSGYASATKAPRAGAERSPSAIEPCWQVDAPGKAFVDFQNDVAVSDIAQAKRESFRSVEHLKRYTTLGMAPDQGKTSNVNALAIMAALTGRGIEETGTTRFRFPYAPIALGAFAGRHHGDLFRPLRRMPAHDRHVALGATLEDYGGWLRPSYYARNGETPHAAEQREALAVRNAAGIFEGSPLGKIEVKGPDAGKFLDLVYANTISTLKVGKVRYGLMLSEQGVVIDDGVTARLGDDHFLVSTTSTGAERIADWMEEWLQCEWQHLDVVVAPVTTAWGVLTVTGPDARAIVEKVGTDIDIGAETFRHMSFAAGHVGGIPARMMRVSFTGEASFEISVPARQTARLWDRFMEVGASYDLTPVGIDAWMILRTEKGYLHIGVDTDGTTTARDVGWGHVLKKGNEFIGKRSMMRAHDSRNDRLEFVGFAVASGQPPLPIGAHIAGTSGSQGYVSSTGHSPILGQAVALGMLRGGRARKGEIVTFEVEGKRRTATVCDPAFFDPSGDRLNG